MEVTCRVCLRLEVSVKQLITDLVASFDRKARIFGIPNAASSLLQRSAQLSDGFCSSLGVRQSPGLHRLHEVRSLLGSEHSTEAVMVTGLFFRLSQGGLHGWPSPHAKCRRWCPRGQTHPCTAGAAVGMGKQNPGVGLWGPWAGGAHLPITPTVAALIALPPSPSSISQFLTPQNPTRALNATSHTALLPPAAKKPPVLL